MVIPKHKPGETIRFRVAPWMFKGPVFTGEITVAKHDDVHGFDYYHIVMDLKGEQIKGIILEKEIVEDDREIQK